MGSKRVSASDRSKDMMPGARARIAEARRRHHCNLLAFWCQCPRLECRNRHGCAGDPFDCFNRQHAAMPRGHKYWRHAEVLSGTTGLATAEEALRAAGLSMPRRLRPERNSPPPPRRAEDAAPATSQAPESEEMRRTPQRREILAQVAPQGIARLEADLRDLGIGVRYPIEWPPADLAPADLVKQEAGFADPARESPEPSGTGTAEATPAAAEPPPPHHADAAARAVVPAPESEEARRRRREELIAKVAPHGFNRLEAGLGEFGITLQYRKIEWRPAGGAKGDTPFAAPPASPGIGTADEPPANAAGAARWQAARLAELAEKRLREGEESRKRVDARLRKLGIIAPGETIGSPYPRPSWKSETGPEVWWPTGNPWKRHRP